MILFDTNVLVASLINQVPEQQEIADRAISQALQEERFVISPLVLSEMTFVLAKLNILDAHFEALDFFSGFSRHAITTSMVMEASKRSVTMGAGKSINDLIHLVYAEHFCRELMTFDLGFKRFTSSTQVRIIHS